MGSVPLGVPVTSKTPVCINHFCEEDIIRHGGSVSLPDGFVYKPVLSTPRLKEGAVPNKGLKRKRDDEEILVKRARTDSAGKGRGMEDSLQGLPADEKWKGNTRATLLSKQDAWAVNSRRRRRPARGHAVLRAWPPRDRDAWTVTKEGLAASAGRRRRPHTISKIVLCS